MADPQQGKTIVELCDERDAIESELHRRALAIQAAAGWLILGFGFGRDLGEASSVTLLSEDRSAVKVVFYSDNLWRFRDADTSPPSTRFRSCGQSSTPDERRSFGASQIVPLAIYEGGAQSVAKWEAANEAERQAGYAKYEREEYQRLREKFEQPSEPAGP